VLFRSKRAWKVRNVVPPSDGMGEAALLSTYAVSAFIYRILIVIGIILFIADQRLLLGLVLVGVAIVGFLIVPSWKGVSYLLTSPELGRTRPRALLTTGLAVCSLVLIVGVVPMPDHVRVTGLVEAEQVTEVYAETPGFLRRASPGGSISRGSHIVTLHNDLLSGRLDALDAELRRLDAARRSAMREGAGSVQIVDEQIAAYRSQRGFLAGRLNGLVAQSEIDGHWIPAQPHQLPGAYVQRGEFVGRIIDPSTLRVRALAGQAVNALIVERGTGDAELRVRGRPEDHLHAQLLEIRPAGEQSLPSVAMSLAAGGPIQTAADDPSHLKAAEPFFELLVQLPDEHQLLPGQRVVVRIALQDKPLAARVWRYTRQLFQQRLRIG
jgi:putative peptide zinc metalloprotease protein